MTKPTSGGILCIFGDPTYVPVSWKCKKQTQFLTLVPRQITEQPHGIPTLMFPTTLQLCLKEDNETCSTMIIKDRSRKIRDVSCDRSRTSQSLHLHSVCEHEKTDGSHITLVFSISQRNVLMQLVLVSATQAIKLLSAASFILTGASHQRTSKMSGQGRRSTQSIHDARKLCLPPCQTPRPAVSDPNALASSLSYSSGGPSVHSPSSCSSAQNCFFAPSSGERLHTGAFAQTRLTKG